MNIWESQLLADPIELRGGYYRVPAQPGLGIEIDQQAVEQYRVDYSWVDPPRHVYRYAPRQRRNHLLWLLQAGSAQ